MRVLCENCGTTYKIPDSKLVREVNRATCRKCGYMMVIRTVPSTPSNRPAQHDAPGESEEERTLVTSLADVEKRAKEQAAAMEAQTARVDPVEGPEETETHEHTDAPMTFDPGAEPAFEEDLSDELSPDADIENDLPTMEEPTQAPDEPAPPPPPPAPKAPAKPAAKAAAPPKPVPNIASGKPAPKQPAQTRQTAAVKEPGTTTQPTLYGVPSPVQDAAQPSEASRQRQRSHDPSGDMTLVLMGTLLVIGGALILAFNAKGEPGIRFLGLLITLFGAFASFLVVATSNRGRKPASVVISLFLSVIGAVMTAGIAFVVVPAGDGPSLLTTLTQGLKMPTVATAPVSATPPVAEAPVAAAEAPVTAAEAPAAGADGVESSVEALLNSAATPETAPATTPVAAAPVAAAPVAAAPVATAPVAAAPVATAPVAAAPTPAASTSSSKPATSSSSSARTSAPSSSSSSSAPVASSSSARTSSTPSSSSRSATPSSTSSSTPSSSSSTSAATPAATAPKATLQPSVVDTMVRTNSGVKRCFAEEKSRNGALPARVDVKITILTSGKVNTAAIKGGDLAGTALDSCLSTAIKGIQFPPFDGDAVSLTYPFIFN